VRGSVEVLVSGWILLECPGCGELVILLGREEDWYLSGERREFACGGCGDELTLAHRVGEGVPGVAGPRRLG
jgi:hypothetical protein